MDKRRVVSMAMMKYAPERGAFLAGIVESGGFVAGGDAPTMRKMFGHETWFLNGYMFTGANEGHMRMVFGAFLLYVAAYNIWKLFAKKSEGITRELEAILHNTSTPDPVARMQAEGAACVRCMRNSASRSSDTNGGRPVSISKSAEPSE